MSSQSAQEMPEGSSRSSLGIVTGIIALVIAAVGFVGPSIGLPIGVHPAFAAGLAVLGLGLVGGSILPLKAPQDFAAGVFIIVIAAIAIVASLTLNFRTTTGVGPGMMPRATGMLLVLMGGFLIFGSLTSKGPALDRWSIRSMVFVLGSALVFGWTIRSLGLIVAGPLAVMVSAFADRDTKWVEVFTFAAIMTFACIALFSWGLKLPIPIWPTQTPFIPGFEPYKFDVFKLFG